MLTKQQYENWQNGALYLVDISFCQYGDPASLEALKRQNDNATHALYCRMGGDGEALSRGIIEVKEINY